jgi:hypothetical protein
MNAAAAVADEAGALLEIALHPKQGLAYESLATEILFGGAAGGGKSFFMRVVAMLWCMAIAGLQVYLFRRTYDDLIKNHIEGPKGLRTLLAPLVLAGWVQMVENEIRFWNGSRIYLCHCEHEKHRFKYQGAEMHVLLIDELTLFTDVIYRYLRSRVRMTSITLPPEYLGHFPRVLCASNPGNIGHGFVKSTFVADGDEAVVPFALRRMPDSEGGMLRQYIPATLDDNPSMGEDDPTYRARIRGMGNAGLVRAFELGDWNAVLGAYLEGVWDEGLHVVEPFIIPATWKVWRAMDWGFARPYAVYWFAMDFDGCVYIWRELYGYGGAANVGTREEAGAVAAKIVAMEKRDERMGYEYRQNPADSAIFSNIGAEQTIARLFRKGGVKWVECMKGPRSRVTGAQLIVELLRNGKLKVFSTCKHWIRTVPALMPDEDDPEDVDTRQEDHAWDTTRYGLGPIRSNPQDEAQKSELLDETTYKVGDDYHIKVGDAWKRPIQ